MALEPVGSTSRPVLGDGLIGHPERVWQEICQRLTAATATNLGTFAARQSCPPDSGRIPDEEEARLVLIHPGRVHKRGDRKDYYESLSDVWEMFALVAQQRKRREIDPIVNTLRRCRDELTDEGLGEHSQDAEARARFRRVHDLLDFLTLMEGLAQRFF